MMADRHMPSSFDEDTEYHETGWKKMSRKLREEPLIPLGTALTCLALYNAFRANRRGNHEQVQRMFRARIWAQTFTVTAMVAGGAYYGKDREKRAELVKLEAQQRAEERHARWLHELEIRDQEERDLQEAMRKRKERVEARRAAGVEKDKTTGPQGEAAASAAAADEKKEGGDGGGGGVLGSLSSVGGWFGSKKGGEEAVDKPAEEKKAGPAEEKKAGPAEKKAGSAEEKQKDAETPKK